MLPSSWRNTWYYVMFLDLRHRAPWQLWLLPLPVFILAQTSRTLFVHVVGSMPRVPMSSPLCSLLTGFLLAVCIVPQQRTVHLWPGAICCFLWILAAAACITAVCVADYAGPDSLLARVCVGLDLSLGAHALLSSVHLRPASSLRITRSVCWSLYTEMAPCTLLPQLIFLVLYG